MGLKSPKATKPSADSSPADIVNGLKVYGRLLVAQRGKELILGVNNVSSDYYASIPLDRI